MAELLIFHHAQGPTPGVRAFGERMAAAGHAVHLPDLHDGRTFETLGAPWPAGAPLQIHIMDRDPLASPPEVDLETAQRLDAELEEASFFAHPGEAHLFADESLPSYDAPAARLAEKRVLELLG